MKRPTVYDVAEHAGVSTATVSRTLQNPQNVRASNRERVLAAVNELGYVPSGSARGLATSRTGVLGLFLPEFDAIVDLHDLDISPVNPRVQIMRDRNALQDDKSSILYFDEVLRGSELEAWRSGFSLMVGIGREYSPRELESVLTNISGQVDGLIVVSRMIPEETLHLIARRIPVVVVAEERHGDEFDHVSVSNRAGMKALVEHLFDEHGIHDPVYMAGPSDSPDDAERRSGFIEALHHKGVNPYSLPMLSGEFSRERARSIALDLIARQALPRALVCANDQMALGVLDVFNAEGIRVPEDVIVTGFDGIRESNASRPRLTTVKQPMLDLGRAAVRLLVSRLVEGDSWPRPQEVVLPVTVLLRDTCEGQEIDRVRS